MREIRHRRRQEQQRGGEDRRNDAGGVQLERQEGALPLVHLVADLTARIGDRHAPLRPLHEHDEGDDDEHHHDDGEHEAGRDRPLAAHLEQLNDRRGQPRDDAGENDERRSVADAARGYLLAEPDEEHGPPGQRHDRRDAEQEPRVADDAGPSFEADRNAVGLKHRKEDGEIAGVLVEDLAALLALFLDRFERRDHRAQELDDDRGRDIGHDVEREHRHALHGAAREHVEHVENALLLPEKGGLERLRVDAGQRDIGPEAEDDERAQREPDALLELVGLGEGRPVDIGCELFGGRRHGALRAAPGSERSCSEMAFPPRLILARRECPHHMVGAGANANPDAGAP